MNTQPSSHQPRDEGPAFLAPPVEADEIGRLGHYRVLKELGRGGMGAVFLAEDTLLKRRVALKVMLPHLAGDAARARFLREARAVAALKHDHVVTVYATGEENGVPFLAMELLAGKTLDDWLRPDRRATPAQVLTIGRQIAEGLAAAHAAGLVHRDIKPANVWLEAPKGRVKLLDFGLARGAGGGDPGLTGAGDILGTPAYMAPEQARGQPVDHRCDLFSLGCVLYRMATGRLPFQGESAYAVIVAVASEEPAAPRAVNPDVPVPLETLILKLLAKDAAARPASAAAVLAEMRRIAADLGGTEKLSLPADGMAETAAWHGDEPRRGPRRFLVGGLVVAALLAAVVVLVVGRGSDPEPKEPDLPPAPTTKSDPDPPPTAKVDPELPDPTAAGDPPPSPTLSLVGTWELDPADKGKGSALVFSSDGRVSRNDGFQGKWVQTGRKVVMVGKNVKAGFPSIVLKGEVEPDGKMLRVVNTKGKLDFWQRRP